MEQPERRCRGPLFREVLRRQPPHRRDERLWALRSGVSAKRSARCSLRRDQACIIGVVSSDTLPPSSTAAAVRRRRQDLRGRAVATTPCSATAAAHKGDDAGSLEQEPVADVTMRVVPELVREDDLDLVVGVVAPAACRTAGCAGRGRCRPAPRWLAASCRRGPTRRCRAPAPRRAATSDSMRARSESRSSGLKRVEHRQEYRRRNRASTISASTPRAATIIHHVQGPWRSRDRLRLLRQGPGRHRGRRPFA